MHTHCLWLSGWAHCCCCSRCLPLSLSLAVAQMVKAIWKINANWTNWTDGQRLTATWTWTFFIRVFFFGGGGMVARYAASTSREQDAQTVHNMHCACSRQAANASVLNDQSWSWMPEPELVTITTTIRTICRYCTLNCITTPLLSATAADAAVCNNQLCIVVDKLLAGLLKCKIAARALTPYEWCKWTPCTYTEHRNYAFDRLPPFSFPPAMCAYTITHETVTDARLKAIIYDTGSYIYI